MTDCQICIEKFNGRDRKQCVCPYCSVGYCRECVGTWLTTLVDEPRCPNDACKKAWSREFIDSIVTKVWRDSVYRQYREQLLLDRERALLPATQPRIEAINEAKRVEKELVVPMRERRREIQLLQRQLEQEAQGLQTQIWDMTNHAERLRNGIGVDEAAAKQRNVFIRRCPSNGCRGFLSSAWKCGVCELYSCPDCQEVKGVARDSAHTCDPGALETAKLIAKDTKACPKCGEMITKIDGCDQMWCVSCHTAFSWRTGQVASGTVHNPHFYEWQRRMNNGEAPRNPGDIPCGGLVDWAVLRRLLMPKGGAYPNWIAGLELAHRRIAHVLNVDMVHLAQAAVNINDNIDLRIEYLLKVIDDAQMSAVLQMREKKREKEIETRRVYETLTGAATDIFRRILTVAEQKGPAEENFGTLLHELHQLRMFINDALDVLRRRYTCSLQGFDVNWNRLRLVGHRAGATVAEEKTVFGNFVDELTKFQAAYKDIGAPAAGQNTEEFVKPWFAKIRKLQRLIGSFPPGATVTSNLAGNVVGYYDASLKVIQNSTEPQRFRKEAYERERMRMQRFLAEWTTHAATLELVVKKPANVIE